MTEAVEKLWDQQVLEHEAWLRTVVRSRVTRPDEVEDVLQTVMADALAFSDRRTEVRAVGPWLYRLAVNAVLQFRRKCGRRRKLHDQIAHQSEVVTQSEPLDLVLGDERRELVQSALQGMSGEDVEVLMLKYVHGWSYTQISQQLGLDGYKVANRLRRARTRLRQQLLRAGVTEDGV